MAALDIKRSGSQPSTKGQVDYFTGTVRIDPLFQANDPARTVGASVTFEPGSRTAWHTHPLGQTLIAQSRIFTQATLFGFLLVKSIGMVRQQPLP
jgi:quercetin dioxygenase-like cupin family protein